MESALAPLASAPDRSTETLLFLQQLLARGSEPGTVSPVSLRQILEQLVAVMGGTRAGLHLLPQLEPVAWTGDDPLEGLPWESAPVVLERAKNCPTALAVPEPGVGDGGYLLTVLRTPAGAWLFWLHDARRAEWTPGECATWSLASTTLLRWLETSGSPRWAEQLDRAVRQDLLESANVVIRRLAHDYGNVFTSLLGFSELSLTQHLPANSPLHRYLTELHQSAQDGAKLTHRLRLLSRRQAQSVRSTPPGPLLTNEEARFRTQLHSDIQFSLELSRELPSVSVDAIHLQMVLGCLLDNARESLGSKAGNIRLIVRPVVLTREDCLDYFGTPHPGPYLELRVEDDGPGLTEQARQQLFRDPFFSSKNRKAGFGLATAYGILAAHQGGIRLIETPGQRGIAASVVVPLAPVGRSNHGAVLNPLSTTNRAFRNERVLVIDDDPQILPLVCMTLEQAGYRVQATRNVREARARLDAPGADPFHLILTDIVMPEETGIEFIQSILQKEPQTRYLFMSGQVGPDFLGHELARDHVMLLPKPFLPENLLRAVREAIDRPHRANTGHYPTREPATKR